MVRPLAISAPSSLMLLGEHAVLHGHPCLVAAIEKRVRVSVIPRNDGLVSITSSLGHYAGDRDDLPDHPSFRFVIAALKRNPSAFSAGLEMSIHADMPATIGFGTSAAVTVAVVGALQMSAQGVFSPAPLLREARSVIQQVQGRGSGADAAASIFGGVVHYHISDDTAVVVHREPLPVTALYCGYKTPTAEVIALVNEAWTGRGYELDILYDLMADVVHRGKAALTSGHHSEFGNILNEGHELMKELGVSTPELEQCVERLRRDTSITGAKISGSGLGDCAIGWGRATGSLSNFSQYDIMSAQEGIRLE